MSRTILQLLCLMMTFASAATALAADRRPGAFIVAPKEGAFVGQIVEFTGKTFLRGEPLALVRAVDGNGHWWVQRTIQRNERGLLKGTLQFGNALAEPGTRFAFVIVVVQTPLELEFFTKRESMAEIPTTVPKSEIRTVIFGRLGAGPPRDEKPAGDKPAGDKPETRPAVKPSEPPPANEPLPANEPPSPATTDPPPATLPNQQAKDAPAKTPLADPGTSSTAGDRLKPGELGLAILQPLENAKVQRFEELVGRMKSDDLPVVLVRPEGVNEQWWVQDKAVFGGGKYFKSKLRFGNEKTPVGTRFMLLIISPMPGSEASTMEAGTALPRLPRGIRRSKEVIVELGPPPPPTGEK